MTSAFLITSSYWRNISPFRLYFLVVRRDRFLTKRSARVTIKSFVSLSYPPPLSPSIFLPRITTLPPRSDGAPRQYLAQKRRGSVALEVWHGSESYGAERTNDRTENAIPLEKSSRDAILSLRLSLAKSEKFAARKCATRGKKKRPGNPDVIIIR